MICSYITGLPGISIIVALLMLLASFLFSAVAAYMAGVVGSSNSPISGVTIATILSSSLLLLAFLGTGQRRRPRVGHPDWSGGVFSGSDCRRQPPGSEGGKNCWRDAI